MKRTQEQVDELKKPLLVKDSTYAISLSKFLGKKIVDIGGYPTAPFDGVTYVFDISFLILEDGTQIYVEGEHDVAYLPADEKIKELSEENLKKYSDVNDEEEDDEDEEDE